MKPADVPTPLAQHVAGRMAVNTPRAPRAFVAGPFASGETIALPDGPARHLVQALRLGIGDRVTLFDGRGGEYAADLIEIGKRRAVVRIGAHDPREAEPPQSVRLVQAVSRGDRMDVTLQKAVELGVAAIQPLVSARSAPLPPGERLRRRVAHWQGIVVSACEQSGRNRVPPVADPCTLGDWLAAPADALRLLLAPGGATRLADLPAPGSASTTLAVGPEGGFSDEEIAAFLSAGFRAIDMGPRILRTETAALAALAQMQCLWWDEPPASRA